MASLAPKYVRHLRVPSHELVPRAVWLRVIRELGDEVFATFTAASAEGGRVRVTCWIDENVLAKIHAIFRECGVEFCSDRECGEDEDYDDGDGDGPWSSDPDAWKG